MTIEQNHQEIVQQLGKLLSLIGAPHPVLDALGNWKHDAPNYPLVQVLQDLVIEVQKDSEPQPQVDSSSMQKQEYCYIVDASLFFKDPEDGPVPINSGLAAQLNAEHPSKPFKTLKEACEQMLAWEKQGYNAFCLSSDFPEDVWPSREKEPEMKLAEDELPERAG